MWFFFRFITWEQRKAEKLFISYVEKGFPELPVLSATQDKGMVYRDDTGKSIFHDKSNEIGYKRVQPGQFVIHLRSFQGGFAHSAILGITSPAYTIFGFKEGEKQCDLYWKYVFSSSEFVRRLETVTYGIRDGRSISYDEFLTMKFIVPRYEEQVKIANILIELDNLITLHQRKDFSMRCGYDIFLKMVNTQKMANAWEQRKLGDTIDFYSGLTYSPSDVVKDNGVFVLRSSNVREGEIVDEDNVYVRAGAVNSDNVNIGDIIVVVRNGSRSLIGKHAKIKKNMPQTVIGAFMTGLRYENSSYLNAVLNTSIFEKEIEKDLGATINQITTGAFKKMVFPFPKQHEQLQIGDFFEQIDNLITLHQREHRQKKNPFLNENRSLFREAIANAWEQRKLGEVANIQKGQQLGKAEMSNNGAFYVLNGGMEPSGYTNQYNTFANTISISEGGNSCGYVSLNLEQFWSGGHNYTLQNPRIDTFFLYQWLKRHEKGIMALRVGSGLPNIQKSALQDVIVAYPKKSEQRAIAEILNKIDNLITLHQRGLIKIQGDKNGKKRSFRRIVQRLF